MDLDRMKGGQRRRKNRCILPGAVDRTAAAVGNGTRPSAHLSSELGPHFKSLSPLSPFPQYLPLRGGRLRPHLSDRVAETHSQGALRSLEPLMT